MNGSAPVQSIAIAWQSEPFDRLTADEFHLVLRASNANCQACLPPVKEGEPARHVLRDTATEVIRLPEVFKNGLGVPDVAFHEVLRSLGKVCVHCAGQLHMVAPSAAPKPTPAAPGLALEVS
jgi:hypothetical protein